MSMFVLKYYPLGPNFRLYDALIHLHVYCFTPHFLSYTFIWPYMFISFLQIFVPTYTFISPYSCVRNPGVNEFLFFIQNFNLWSIITYGNEFVPKILSTAKKNPVMLLRQFWKGLKLVPIQHLDGNQFYSALATPSRGRKNLAQSSSQWTPNLSRWL